MVEDRFWPYIKTVIPKPIQVCYKITNPSSISSWQSRLLIFHFSLVLNSILFHNPHKFCHLPSIVFCMKQYPISENGFEFQESLVELLYGMNVWDRLRALVNLLKILTEKNTTPSVEKRRWWVDPTAELFTTFDGLGSLKALSIFLCICQRKQKQSPDVWLWNLPREWSWLKWAAIFSLLSFDMVMLAVCNFCSRGLVLEYDA